MAREHGVEELLPYTPKGTEERLRKRVEFGLRVKGTGVGQQVKGHAHERHLVAKWVVPVFPNPYCSSVPVLTDIQARETQESNVGDAQAYQGMETGKEFLPVSAVRSEYLLQC